jgi:thymidylate kinase
LFIKYNKFIKRRELAYLAIINGWHKLLQKKIHQSNQVLLLDQGPIFIIAYLKILGSQELFDACMNAWWEKIYNWWKQTIDLVIWLDATDEILYSRINNRLQEHLLKGQSREACLLWLTKYQSVYREIINRISDSNPNLQIVHIDSGRCSVDNIADQIQIEFYKTTHNNNR